MKHEIEFLGRYVKQLKKDKEWKKKMVRRWFTSWGNSIQNATRKVADDPMLKDDHVDGTSLGHFEDNYGDMMKDFLSTDEYKVFMVIHKCKSQPTSFQRLQR